MSQTFRPTHQIRFTKTDGTSERFDVMLDEEQPRAGGPAYTQAEWDATANADWEVDADGKWTHQGQATPGGASGEIEIVDLVRTAKLQAAYQEMFDLEHEADQLFGPVLEAISVKCETPNLPSLKAAIEVYRGARARADRAMAALARAAGLELSTQSRA